MYLTIHDLSLDFGEKEILKDISLSVASGELVTLLGPSGSGKSTLLRCIAGLEKQKKGEITLDGQSIEDKSVRERGIGFVFQNYALFPTMTVFENVAFGLKVKKLPKEKWQKKVFELLDLVQLTEFANQNVQRLSGGQKQRVALIRALATEPKLLLLDEPLSALDAKIRRQLQKDLQEIQKKLGITMIFVTHDQDEAMLISDRVFVLDKGRIAQVSSPYELYTAPQSQFVADFIGNYLAFEWHELAPYTTAFAAKDNKWVFYIRPELISFAETADSIKLPVSLQGSATLGNIRRYWYKTDRGKTIVVDRLNDQKKIPEVDAVYLNFLDMIRVPAAAFIG